MAYGFLGERLAERACGRGHRHHDAHVTVSRVRLVHEAEVHDVDPDLRIDHVAKGVEDLGHAADGHA